jgi:hypothetical protein
MLAQIVLFDGFDPLDVIAPYEVLFAGGMVTEGALNVELVSAEGVREVPSGTGPLLLRVSARLDPPRVDLIVVPGAAGRLADDDASDDAERGDIIPVILRSSSPTNAAAPSCATPDSNRPPAEMTGRSKAGRLPSSKVTGHRAARHHS